MFGKQFIIKWNNCYPKDRRWRKKYNVSFGSKEHREISQIDIYLDALEDTLFNKYIEQHEMETKALETYKKEGKWLKESDLGEKEFDDLFDNIDISKLNQ